MRAIWPMVAGSERNGRQQQVAQAFKERIGATGNQRVHQHEAGVSGHEIEVRRQTAGGRQDVQHIAGQNLQEKCQEETRRDGREDRDDTHDIVGPAILPIGGHNAERNAEHHRDENRGDYQFQRRGEGIPDVVVDGSLGQQRPAEVAVGETDDEQTILLHDRAIEAELLL